MRSLQRVPVHYRAALTLPGADAASAVADGAGAGSRAGRHMDATSRHPASVHTCVTGDLHARGALLHVTDGVPAATQVGSRGHVRIEIGAGDTVEFVVDVRHVSGQRIGVQFVG